MQNKYYCLGLIAVFFSPLVSSVLSPGDVKEANNAQRPLLGMIVAGTTLTAGYIDQTPSRPFNKQLYNLRADHAALSLFSESRPRS